MMGVAHPIRDVGAVRGSLRAERPKSSMRQSSKGEMTVGLLFGRLKVKALKFKDPWQVSWGPIPEIRVLNSCGRRFYRLEISMPYHHKPGPRRGTKYRRYSLHYPNCS